MIQAKNLQLSFATQDIFKNLSCTFSDTDRIGLVGRNGSGKTTLLKAFAKKIELDGGSIRIAGNKKLAYLPQHVVLESNETVFEEAYSTFHELYSLEQEYKQLEEKMSEDSEVSPEITEIYAYISEKLTLFDQHKYRQKTKDILSGLGFSDFQCNNPVSDLSVGWKMRLVLAKLLLEEADFYLFDEPTNHLDIFAKDWLLSFLKKAPFGFMLVCHERYFLNELCTNIFELENGNGKLYKGNFSDYEKQKERDRVELELQFKQQQREIKRKQDLIDRFRAKSSKAKMAKSIEKQLEKMERIELPSELSTISFNLTPRIRSGRIILKVENVAHSFGEKKIFKNVSFQIERNQKVAIVAPNGVGKTTLFNLIVGKYPLHHGKISFGSQVEHAIFHQDHTTALNQNNTIYEEVLNINPQKSESEIRNFLGCFLFSKDMVQKKIKVLSGGEKNRVNMIKVLLHDANFLLLDEPTNHLDMETKDILLKALQNYSGTILFVSHDHEFINTLATHVIELTPAGTKTFHGNWHDYSLQKNEYERSTIDPIDSKTSSKRKPANKISNKKNQEIKKECKKIERKIDKLEKEIARHQNKFSVLEYGTKEYFSAVEKLKELESMHEKEFILWENVQKKLASSSN